MPETLNDSFQTHSKLNLAWLRLIHNMADTVGPKGDERTVAALDAHRSDFPDGGWDVAETFGPMAAMHAAMQRVGIGMPCGLVARFKRRAPAEIDAAVGVAAERFPALRSRLVWLGGRPTLTLIDGWRHEQCRAAEISPTFEATGEEPIWRYALAREGEDVWLTAVWAHAAADGRSMMHFLESVGAALDDRPAPIRKTSRPSVSAPVSMIRWLPRFLVERHLPYVKAAEDTATRSPGVTWLSVPAVRASIVLARASAECGGFAAWLAAAACMSFCAQQRGSPKGRVSLNLLIARSEPPACGGFGFAVGSLLMPVNLNRHGDMGSVARRIGDRQRTMMNQAWDQHLERFVGHDPTHHLRFARLEARGLSAPTISVSWKGRYPGLGGENAIDHVACFAASRIAHVSAHVDANGLSLSLASRQSPAAREDLLRRIVGTLDDGAPARVLTLATIPTGDPYLTRPTVLVSS
jgi:hypothetical protein